MLKYKDYSLYEKYDYLGKTFEGRTKVKIGKFPYSKCGFLDDNSNVAIPLIYTNAQDFQEGFAAVKTGHWSSSKWGFINYEGDLVIPCEFKKPSKFSCGLVKVYHNRKWCFIDKTGKKVISLKGYSGSSSFHNGYAIVHKEDPSDYLGETSGVIDMNGNEIIPCIYKCFKIGYHFYCNSILDIVSKYQAGDKDFLKYP